MSDDTTDRTPDMADALKLWMESVEADHAAQVEALKRIAQKREAVLYPDGAVLFDGHRVKYDGANWVLVFPTDAPAANA